MVLSCRHAEVDRAPLDLKISKKRLDKDPPPPSPLICTPLLQQGIARNWKFQFEIWLEAVLLISNTAVQWWASRQWIPNIRKLPFLSFYSENSFKSLERNSDEKKRNSRAPSVLGSAFNQLPTRSDFLPLLGFLRWNAPAAVTSDGNVQHLFRVNSFPREELGQDIFSGRNEKKYFYLNGKFRRNYPLKISNFTIRWHSSTQLYLYLRVWDMGI